MYEFEEQEYDNLVNLAESEIDYHIADRCFRFVYDVDIWYQVLNNFIPSIIKINNEKYRKYRKGIYYELLYPKFGDATVMIYDFLF